MRMLGTALICLLAGCAVHAAKEAPPVMSFKQLCVAKPHDPRCQLALAVDHEVRRRIPGLRLHAEWIVGETMESIVFSMPEFPGPKFTTYWLSGFPPPEPRKEAADIVEYFMEAVRAMSVPGAKCPARVRHLPDST